MLCVYIMAIDLAAYVIGKDKECYSQTVSLYGHNAAQCISLN